MKNHLFLLLGAAALLLCPSCITAAVTAAATGATTAATGASGTGLGLAGLSNMLSSGAPESLDGCTLTLKGDYNGTLTSSGTSYTRQSDAVAVLTQETETFYLTFTGSSEGTYSYENRGADGSVITGHGSFTLTRS